MPALSTDLRQRATAAYDAGEGIQQQVADRSKVSVSWPRKALRRRRLTGSIDPRPHGGGRARAIDGEAAGRLRRAVAATPDATLAQLAEAAGLRASPSMVHRALEDLGVTRKKSPGGRPSRTGPS